MCNGIQKPTERARGNGHQCRREAHGHGPTNDLKLGSCNGYRSKPLSNCNARPQIGTARHELVETPVGRHRSIRRPVHVRSSQNVLPVDSRSADQRRRTWPSSRQAGRPGRSYPVQSPSCPERAGERGGDDRRDASRHTPSPRSASASPSPPLAAGAARSRAGTPFPLGLLHLPPRATRPAPPQIRARLPRRGGCSGRFFRLGSMIS